MLSSERIPVIVALLLSIPSLAAAQDQDGDGVVDSADVYPCDPALAGESFHPAEGTYGTLLFEDEWPAAGDQDVNDLVLDYNYHVTTDAQGRATAVTGRFFVAALGGRTPLGLGVHFPFAASAVSAATITDAQGTRTLAPSATDVQATFQLSPDLSSLFAGQTQPFNVVSGAPAVAGQSIVVQVDLTSGTDLSGAPAPFDVFVFHASDPGREIHLPSYSGTSAMDTTLFGTIDDGSAGGRSFVDTSGIPFVLEVPQSSDYPLEYAHVAQLWPAITGFASSGGATNTDFYATSQDAFRFTARPSAPALPSTNPDTSCLPPATVTPPSSVLFIGNSFTLQGPIPVLVESLARYAGFDGFAPLNIDYRAVGGQSLSFHRNDSDPAGAPARVLEGWDAVVLQDYSTRPTDQVGPALQFKQDATWFHDLARSANPTCRVILYETWARRYDHSFYPGTFLDSQQMQAELRYHYNDAADNYIPLNSTSPAGVDVQVALVGDAWESQLAGGEPPRLHASDRYHGGPAGQYLNALVLYSTLFGRRADGLVPLNGLDAATAQLLQDTADGITGATGWGARPGAPLPIATQDDLRLDFGPDASPGWPTFDQLAGTQIDLPTQSGATTSAYVTTHGFVGTQTLGSSATGLGVPAEVSRDTLWVGSGADHATALGLEAQVVVRGLPAGTYRVQIFASRSGDDGGNGRLTRYTIGTATRDLEAADNSANIAQFDSVALDHRGEIRVRVGVSPAGTARYAYVGTMWITRVGP